MASTTKPLLKVQVTGLAEFCSALQGFSERRLAAAGATALTRTARRIAAEWRQDLEASLDRPTPATVRSVVVKPASASDLEAEVSIKAEAGQARPVEWLMPHQFGGRRQAKKFEQALQSAGAMPRGFYAVPGPAAKLDAYGNVSRGQIVQVLNQLGSNLSVGYRRVIGATTRKRAASAAAKGRKYIALPNGEGRRKPGVYERTSDGRLAAVFWFVSKATYQRRLSLIERAQDIGPAVLGEEMGRAIQQSAARLAARGR